MNRYEKLLISIRYWLLGRSQQDPAFLRTINALEFAKTFHTGTRKDGITPEFQHQLEIAHFLRSISTSLLFPAETIAVGFVHDVREDYDVSHEEITELFGSQIAHSTELMTKKFRGTSKPLSGMFLAMAEDPIASIAKGADRINNLNSMKGVFTLDKQKHYMAEVEDLFLPMLKSARRKFVQQEMAYENIKFMLKSQLHLLAAVQEGIPDATSVIGS